MILLLTFIVSNILLLDFLLCAIMESYKKVSENLRNQEYLARARILHEH